MCCRVLANEAAQPQAHLHAGGEEPTAHLKPTMCRPVLAIETGQSFVQSQTQGQEPAALSQSSSFAPVLATEAKEPQELPKIQEEEPISLPSPSTFGPILAIEADPSQTKGSSTETADSKFEKKSNKRLLNEDCNQEEEDEGRGNSMSMDIVPATMVFRKKFVSKFKLTSETEPNFDATMPSTSFSNHHLIMKNALATPLPDSPKDSKQNGCLTTGPSCDPFSDINGFSDYHLAIGNQKRTAAKRKLDDDDELSGTGEDANPFDEGSSRKMETDDEHRMVLWKQNQSMVEARLKRSKPEYIKKIIAGAEIEEVD